jgi:hypothetical protein
LNAINHFWLGLVQSRGRAKQRQCAATEELTSSLRHRFRIKVNGNTIEFIHISGLPYCTI